MVAAGQETDKDWAGLLGPVQNMRIEITGFSRHSGKWVEGTPVLLYIYTYDKTGNKVETTEYDDAYDVDSFKIRRLKWTLSYNSDGRLMEVVNLNNDGEPDGGKVVNSYDANGNLFKEESFENGNPSGIKKTYVYDSFGNVINKTSFVEGKKEMIEVSRYDTKGNKVEGTFYEGDGSLLLRTAYNYNKKGRLLEEINYFPGSNPPSKTVYVYDRVGNQTERIAYRGDGSVSSTQKHTYDSEGNKIRTGIHITEKLRSGEEFICQHGCPDDEVILREHDSNGNWIKKTRILGSKPLEVTYRTITYYSQSETP